MGFVGKETVALPKAKALKYYEFVRKTHLSCAVQNAFTASNADTYCRKLFAEAPQAKSAVQGKLAVVTGVTLGGAGYHMALELALSAEMHVVIMGRSQAKLEKAEEAILKEAEKRTLPKPTLYHVLFDLDDLKTAVDAAEKTKEIAKEYGGMLHVLVNNAGATVPEYKLTKQGVEANVGRNFLAPHLLTEKVLPLLEKASTDTYKARCVFVASLGYCLVLDLDPTLLLNASEFGGTPKDFFKFEEGTDDAGNTTRKSTIDVMSFLLQYSRGKLGSVASACHMAKLYPKINFTSQQPGSIVSNFGNAMGFGGLFYYYGFYLLQYSASQGACTALRAALDPDFNTEPDLQGAYLHADGNPWSKDDLKIDDPETSQVYEWDKYSKAVYENVNKLIDKILKE